MKKLDPTKEEYIAPLVEPFKLSSICNLLIYLSLESDVEDFEEGEW